MKPRQIGASEFVMKKISEMSKEQTPIRKLIDEHIEPAWEGAYNADKEALEKDIQEIINAKVLEERDKNKREFLEALGLELKGLSDCYKAHAKDNPRKEVCQVLHTLIMEKQEQIAQTKQK